MTRVLLLPSEPLFGEREVVFELPHALVGGFALELSLLVEGMAEAVRLRASSGKAILLTVDRGTLLGRALVHHDKEETCFKIGKNQAEYLLATVLRAHRDGAAEVNHIHIEGSDGTKQFDLTLMFELFAEPMSAKEAMKLID